MIPVRRLPPTCWDQTLVMEMFDPRRFTVDPVEGLWANHGAVLVVPARYYTPEQVNELTQDLSWVLVMLVSDEESTFDHRALQHPNLRLWVMTPRPGRHEPGEARYVGEGYAPHFPALLPTRAPSKRLDWAYAGQVNHPSRKKLAKVLAGMDHGILVETGGFTQGLPHHEYADLLATAKIAPCPAGPETADSFRLYEALEAGCIPVVEPGCFAYRDNYWPLLLGCDPPFPALGTWTDLPAVTETLLEGWPANANRIHAWWLGEKRRMRRDLDRDLAALDGTPLVDPLGPPITVLVPTSPIPSHPDTGVIEATVASIRTQLPTADILVMVDGIRPEQEHRRGDYEQYVRRLLWLCARQWENVTPLVHDDHQHQARLTRHALAHVDTPLVLFVEHDTPIEGDIDWTGLTRALLAGDVNLVRFHHETRILAPHEHLMVDREPTDHAGVPLLRTVQWSQRPHLARADYYRRILTDHFDTEERWMIEDRMHSVLDCAWRDEGVAGWERHRLAMYAPDGSLLRSRHLDGRQGDPKWVDR